MTRPQLLSRRSRAFLVRFRGKPQPHFGHLLKNCLVLFVLGLAGKTTALVGEFSIIRWRFHAGTTRAQAAPFRKKLWHARGTFRRPLPFDFARP